MKKQQITKTAGEYLGIKPDENGFYFISANAKITGAQLAYLLQATQTEIQEIHIKKINDYKEATAIKQNVNFNNYQPSKYPHL